MKLQCIDETQYSTLITLVNEIFQDYPIPIRWNMQDFKLDIQETGLSLKDSFILWEENEAIGFIVVGIRDKFARIDAMGVKTKFRGTEASEYLFQNCIENLKWKKVTTVQLEVLESEKRAVRFYEKHGFLVNRKLLAYRFGVNPNLSARFFYKESSGKAIHELAVEAQQLFNRKPNWQRVPASLQNAQDRYKMDCIYFEKNSTPALGFVVWGENPDNFFIVDCYRTVTDIELIDLFHDAVLFVQNTTGRTTGVISNLPEDDRLNEAILKLGGELIFQQLEMELKLR